MPIGIVVVFERCLGWVDGCHLNNEHLIWKNWNRKYYHKSYQWWNMHTALLLCTWDNGRKLYLFTWILTKSSLLNSKRRTTESNRKWKSLITENVTLKCPEKRCQLCYLYPINMILFGVDSDINVASVTSTWLYTDFSRGQTTTGRRETSLNNTKIAIHNRSSECQVQTDTLSLTHLPFPA